jgi:hypothetical protein
MTVRRLFSIAARLLGLVVLVTSGIYLLVYLYRWEWNRALISGLFFVAAEVALATGALMRRMDRVERRVDDLGSGSPDLGAEPPERDVPVTEREHPFAWLQPDGLGVFVPVLLGIGVILSAIAYVVERVAGVSGTWMSDRSVDRRLAFVGGSGDRAIAPVAAAHATRREERLSAAAAVAAFLVVLALSVLAIAGLTRYEPGAPGPPGSETDYAVSVAFRGIAGDPFAVTRTLSSSCGALLDDGSSVGFDRRGETVVLRVSPSPDPDDERRFLGCLNDVTLDRVIVQAEPLDPAGDPEAEGSRVRG